MTCEIAGCDKVAVARKMCRTHYSRWHRTGDPTTAREKLPKGAFTTCTVEGCDKPHVTKGLCEMHRWRVRAEGEPGEPGPRLNRRTQTPKGPCAIEGCDLPAKTKAGHCKRHYERIRRTGHPGPVGIMVRANGTGGLTQEGYIRLTLPGGRRVMEHVHVMEQLLDRQLEPGENVHHKNGIRSDNRPENLELWVSMQPTGQRVEDLITFVVEHYPEEVRAALAARTNL
jgi:HNH endonuclease